MDVEVADFSLELEADIQHTDSYSELEHVDSSVLYLDCDDDNVTPPSPPKTPASTTMASAIPPACSQ